MDESEDQGAVDAAAHWHARILRGQAYAGDAARRAQLAGAVDGRAGATEEHRRRVADALATVERSSFGAWKAGPADADTERLVDAGVARALDRLALRAAERGEHGTTPILPGAAPPQRDPADDWAREVRRLATATGLADDDLVARLSERGVTVPADGPATWGAWTLAEGPRTARLVVEGLGGDWTGGGYSDLHRAATREARADDDGTAEADELPRITGMAGVLAADPRSVVTRLDADPSAEFGRGELVDDLVERVAHAAPDVTVLLGPPGHGKSSVAAAVADRVRADGRTAVISFRAVDLRALAVGLERALRRLRVPDRAVEQARHRDLATTVDRLWSLLDEPDRPFLVVLAGAGRSAVGDRGWVRRPQHGHVVVTSRFGTPAAWRPARVAAMRELGPEAGGRVLLERLRALGAGRAGADAESEAKALSTLLSGMPLALARVGELVVRSGQDLAAWVRRVDAHRGADAIDVMCTVALETLGSHRAGGERLLRLLCCFAPDEPLPASVVGESADLDALVRIGLVERHRGGDRQTDTVRVPEAIASRAGTWEDPAETTARARRAVRLLTARLAGLDPGRLASWPVVIGLEAHVVHLVQNAALVDVDDGVHAEVLALGERAARALMRAGEPASATTLLELTLARHGDLADDHRALLAARLTRAWMTALAHGGDLSRAARMCEALVDDTTRVLERDDELTVAALDTLAWVRAESDDLDGAAELFARALEVHTRGGDRRDGPALAIRHRLAMVRARQGHLVEAMGELEDVLAARVAQLGDDHLDVYSTTYRLHWAQSRVGRHDLAVAGFDALLERVNGVLEPDHPLALIARSRCAWARMWAGRADDALDRYATLVPDEEKVLGRTHRRVLISRHNVSALELWLGRAQAAATDLSEVVAARTETLGPDHPFTLDSRELHAWATLRVGRAEDADRALLAVLADRRRTLGPEHESTLATRYRLLRVVLHRGRVADAEQRARVLIADVESPSSGSRTPPTVPVVRGPLPAGSQAGALVASVRHSLAICCALQGRVGEARELLTAVLRVRREVLDDDTPEILLARDRLAWVTALMHPVEGLEMVSWVRDRRVAVLGVDHPHTLTSEYRVAWALIRAGFPAAALDAHTRLEPRMAALVGPDDPHTLRVRSGRLRCTRLLGRATEALDGARELHRDQLRAQGPRAVDTLRAAEEVGQALVATGREEEALHTLEEVLATRRALFGEEHLDTRRAQRLVDGLRT